MPSSGADRHGLLCLNTDPGKRSSRAVGRHRCRTDEFQVGRIDGSSSAMALHDVACATQGRVLELVAPRIAAPGGRSAIGAATSTPICDGTAGERLRTPSLKVLPRTRAPILPDWTSTSDGCGSTAGRRPCLGQRLVSRLDGSARIADRRAKCGQCRGWAGATGCGWCSIGADDIGSIRCTTRRTRAARWPHG